ncbi:MAG: lipocalin-like domain-containing protein [Acidobacteria bacterium]|nr:lipocalin-like domain-containing protein [Acidobacteriota bacterium]
MPHRLIGNWTLVSYDAVAPDGTRSLPFGRALGRLSYDEHGNMAGQVMRPDRGPVTLGDGSAQQVRAAYIGYIAYFGTYQVNEARDTVIHHVLGALNPAWVGGNQVRRMRFNGDLLELQADVHKGTQIITHVLTWRKLP